jgi:hypothetical protein
MFLLFSVLEPVLKWALLYERRGLIHSLYSLPLPTDMLDLFAAGIMQHR